MALTDTEIKKARPTDKLQKLSDGAGLQLHIVTTGGKLWRWAYRFEGKQKAMALGTYPAVTLAQARDLQREGAKVLASGVDPMAKKKSDKKAKAAANADNFEAVARLWWEHWKHARTSDHHVAQTLRRLEADVFPMLSTRPIAEIEAPELVEMAKEIEKRGAGELAKRSLQVCSMIFRYAIANGKARRNPAIEIRPSDILKARKVENYARVIFAIRHCLGDRPEALELADSWSKGELHAGY